MALTPISNRALKLRTRRLSTRRLSTRRLSTRRLSVRVLAILSLCLPMASAAQEPTEPGQGVYSGNLERLSDEEIEARIAFIEERLDDGQLYSQIWQYGFTTGYSGGVVLGVVGASVTNDKDQRVNFIVTGSKAVLGVARLLWAPHPGRHGGQPIRDVQGESREDKIRRLQVAEALLEENVERARDRWGWQRHVGNAVINFAGAVITWKLGEHGDAISGGLVGLGVGTGMAFSMPWRAEGDLEDYKREFQSVPQTSRVRWSLAPMVTEGAQGAMLRLEF